MASVSGGSRAEPTYGSSIREKACLRPSCFCGHRKRPGYTWNTFPPETNPLVMADPSRPTPNSAVADTQPHVVPSAARTSICGPHGPRTGSPLRTAGSATRALPSWMGKRRNALRLKSHEGAGLTEASPLGKTSMKSPQQSPATISARPRGLSANGPSPFPPSNRTLPLKSTSHASRKAPSRSIGASAARSSPLTGFAHINLERTKSQPSDGSPTWFG